MEIATILSDFLITEHPEQAASVLTKQPVTIGVKVLEDISPVQAVKILHFISPAKASEYVQAMTKPGRIIEAMSVDDAVRVLRPADETTTKRLLKEIKPSHARAIRGKMLVAMDTIAALVEPAPMLTPATTVGEAQTQTPVGTPYTYVVDDGRHLLGVIRTPVLWQESPNQTLASVMKPSSVVCLNHLTPLEAALGHVAWGEYDVLPVINGKSECLGVIRHKVLRQAVKGGSDRMPLQSAVATALDLAELYWGSSAALLFGSRVGSWTESPPRRGGAHG